eukprot:XP_001704047.1 Hypothetical protein GL50803_38444 [Giardia lamblia ATCC 50803]
MNRDGPRVAKLRQLQGEQELHFPVKWTFTKDITDKPLGYGLIHEGKDIRDPCQSLALAFLHQRILSAVHD